MTRIEVMKTDKESEITFRNLAQTDFDQWNTIRTIALDIAPVAFGSSNKDEIPVRKEMFKRNMEKPDHFILGTFNDDELIGIGGFYRNEQVKVKHKGTIWSVFVHPDFQGNGIGRKLMSGILRGAFEIEGLERILIGASANNPAAIELYKSLGFQQYGTEPKCLKHEGKYYDEVLMVLDRADYH